MSNLTDPVFLTAKELKFTVVLINMYMFEKLRFLNRISNKKHMFATT